MTEEAIEIENKAITKAYKELLKVSYQTLTKADRAKENLPIKIQSNISDNLEY